MVSTYFIYTFTNLLAKEKSRSFTRSKNSPRGTIQIPKLPPINLGKHALIAPTEHFPASSRIALHGFSSPSPPRRARSLSSTFNGDFSGNRLVVSRPASLCCAIPSRCGPGAPALSTGSPGGPLDQSLSRNLPSLRWVLWPLDSSSILLLWFSWILELLAFVYSLPQFEDSSRRFVSGICSSSSVFGERNSDSGVWTRTPICWRAIVLFVFFFLKIFMWVFTICVARRRNLDGAFHGNCCPSRFFHGRGFLNSHKFESLDF